MESNLKVQLDFGQCMHIFNDGNHGTYWELGSTGNEPYKPSACQVVHRPFMILTLYVGIEQERQH